MTVHVRIIGAGVGVPAALALPALPCVGEYIVHNGETFTVERRVWVVSKGGREVAALGVTHYSEAAVELHVAREVE